MAVAVRRLLTDRALSARLASGGRQRVEAGFSSDVRLDRIEALYARLLREKSHEATASRESS
jgi:glycosyltransferase involved in cell wall biosynthesis